MGFRLHCPKCESTNVHIERNGYGDPIMVLQCHQCGKQVYGEEAIDALHDEQKREWDKVAPERQKAEAKAEAERRRVAEEDRKILEAERAKARKKQEQKEAEEAARAAELKAWAEKIRKQQAEEAAAKRAAEEAKEKAEQEARRKAAHVPVCLVPIVIIEGICAWKDCDNPVAENSKYCCQECRKKAARWTYHQKKKAERVAARATA